MRSAFILLLLFAALFSSSGTNALPTAVSNEEALAIIHDHKQYKDGTPTGLEFKETRAHGKIWQIPNDVEGRALADKIDFKLSEIAHKLEEGQGKSPF